MSNQIIKDVSNSFSSGKFSRTMLALFLFFVSFSALQATQFKLVRTSKTGNTINLTVPAQIVSVNRDIEKTTYTIWRNGKSYISINNKYNPQGMLPPGTYTVLASPGGSVTIILDTNIRQQTIKLWGRHNAQVTPLWEGNKLVIVNPTTITSATYNGTKGMSIGPGFLYLLSPHNIKNPGPKVLDSAGRVVGETLVGQTLPAGIYTVLPERGTADGIVYGEIVITVQ